MMLMNPCFDYYCLGLRASIDACIASGDERVMEASSSPPFHSGSDEGKWQETVNYMVGKVKILSLKKYTS